MIKIISIGKIKDKNMNALCDMYIKRIQPYHRLEVCEVADEVIPQNASAKDELQVMQKEAEKALLKIKDQEYVILLDLHGEELDSIAFSKK